MSRWCLGLFASGACALCLSPPDGFTWIPKAGETVFALLPKIVLWFQMVT